MLNENQNKPTKEQVEFAKKQAEFVNQQEKLVKQQAEFVKKQEEFTDQKEESDKLQEEFAKNQEELVKQREEFSDQREEFVENQKEFVKLQEEFLDEQEESAKKQDKKVTIDKNGEEIRPTFKDSELSKHIPKDSLFNKLHHYNSATTKSAIAVTNKVDYFNFHYKGIKYTFWKGLALTKSQVKAMPKGYVKEICG